MPVYPDGKFVKEAEWARLIESIPASYTVWKDGTTYRAECLKKGGTDYSGTDAYTVINSALQASTGKIFLKDAVYSMSNYLLVENPLQIVGESKTGTILDFSTTTPATNRIIIKDNNGAQIRNLKVTGVGTLSGIMVAGTSNNILVDNVWVLNNGTGYCLNVTDSPADVILQNSRFDNPRYEGITCSATGGKVTVQNCKFNDIGRYGVSISGATSYSIKNNIIEGWGTDENGAAIIVRNIASTSFGDICGNNLIWKTSTENTFGILIDSELNESFVQKHFSVCHNILKGITGANVGIYLHGHGTAPITYNVEGITVSNNVIDSVLAGITATVSKKVSIEGNIIEACNLSGIHVSGDNTTVNANVVYNCGKDGTAEATYGIKISGDYNVITGNICTDDQETKTQTHGIAEITGVDNNLIANNNVVGNDTAGIIIVGANSQIRNNKGFVTENSGTATIVNTTTSIAVTHGCDYTPSAGDIDVHPIETLNNASFWYVDTITSTQFTIHVNADPGQDVDFKWSVRRV